MTYLIHRGRPWPGRRSQRSLESRKPSLCKTPAMPEAPLRKRKSGLVVDGEGWFVVNARESRWKDEGPLGSYCTFEGKRRFPHFGINVSVLESGERMGMYHREKSQEAFLVLAGDCTLIVEGEERRLTRGLLLLRPGDGAHHRHVRRTVSNRVRRRARTRRRRSRVHGLSSGSPVRSERRTGDDAVRRRLRKGLRRASEVEVRQVPGWLASRDGLR
jgi:quercetin dioxygenase-like cupin family protein